MRRTILIFLALATASFAQTNYARMLAGVDYQSGTTYSVQPADGTKLLSLTNAGSVAVCLSSPGSLCSGVAAGSGSFYGAGSQFSIVNSGGGSVTITCQSCTINGASTLVLNPSVGADIYGDGINFAAIVGFSVSAGSGGASKPGDILRFNVLGDGAWDAVGYPQTYDQVFACSTNVSCAVGMAAGTAPTGCCSESVAGQNPTASAPFLTTTYSAAASGSTSTVIGLQHAENGNTGSWFVRGFWKMTHKLSITAVANNRYWWGLGVWNNGSSLGSNGTNVLGTTVFASDTPNHTFIGWRWSASTDTNFKAVVIQAGASPSTVVLDTGVAGDSNLHTFDVALDSGNTTFSFYIDGKVVGTTPASGITFSPASAGDALATMFFTGDNKNTATAVSVTFGNMAISIRQ